MKTYAQGAVIAVLTTIAGTAVGQDDAFWTGTTGVWSTASSWSGGVVPNNNGDQLYNATLDQLKIDYTVSLNIDVELENFTLDGAGVTLSLDPGRQMLVNQDAMISDGMISGSGDMAAGITVEGMLTISDADLMGAGMIRALGGLNIIGASNVDICNTCVNTGGPSRLEGSGSLSLNQGGELVNEQGGTFSIVADTNRLITGDGTGKIKNSGTLNSVMSSRGIVGETIISGVAFENTGTLNVFAGQVFINSSNDLAPDGILSEGAWNVYGGSRLSLGDSVFQTLDAEVNISGSDAVFENIEQLSTIETNGKFGLFNGANFGDQATSSFVNRGVVEVGFGSRLNAGLKGFGNLDGDGLFGGKYLIEGTFETGANEIRDLYADLTLIGADSVFTGIQALEKVGSGGRFALAGGRNFDTLGNFNAEEGAVVQIGASSTLRVNGVLVNNGTSGVFDAAAFDVRGTLVANNLRIVEISNELILDGVDSQLLDGNGADAIADLRKIRDDGVLRLRNGRSLSNLDDLMVDGVLSIEGGPADAGTRGVPLGTVQVNGSTMFGAASTLEIIINGTDPSQFGQLMTGSAEIAEGATLALVVDKRAGLAFGDEFALLITSDTTGLTGSFGSFLGLEFGDGLSFEILQDGTGVYARVVPAPGVGGVLMVLGLGASRRRRR